MAVDKTIGELPSATQVNDNDLLVLEQINQAKKVSGKALTDYLAKRSGLAGYTQRAQTAAEKAEEDRIAAEEAAADAKESAARVDLGALDQAVTTATTAAGTATTKAEEAETARAQAALAAEGAEQSKTAAQTSAEAAAASAAEVPTIAADRTLSNLTDAALARQNLGAAPSGYGLGLTAQWLQNKDFNTIFECGFYRWDGSANAQNAPFLSGTMIVTSYTSGNFTQIGFDNSSTNINIKMRKITGDVVGEWEWINPPMVMGVEYRTTERWNGKSLYTKLVDLGNMPSNDYKVVSVGSAAYTMLYGEGYMERADGRRYGIFGTGFTEEGYYAAVYPYSGSSPHIQIRTNADLSAFHGYYKIYYTKN